MVVAGSRYVRDGLNRSRISWQIWGRDQPELRWTAIQTMMATMNLEIVAGLRALSNAITGATHEYIHQRPRLMGREPMGMGDRI